MPVHQEELLDLTVNFDEERLLCHMVLDDSFAEDLSHEAGPAFLRVFILENRNSKVVTARYRFLYRRNGEDLREAYVITPPQTGDQEQMVNHLQRTLKSVFQMAMFIKGIPPECIEDALLSFYPPDDEGDSSKTIAWLLDMERNRIGKEQPVLRVPIEAVVSF